jgi:ketosteroid isomerase-like protein
MRIILFIAVLVFIVDPHDSPMRSQQEQRKTVNNPATAGQLSPQQAEVWNEEQNFFRYLNAKDLKSSLSLWDDNFVGWPDYQERPVRKADIASDTAEDFRTAKSDAPPIPLPKPESVSVYGDVAVTFYFWPEADQSSPNIYRITHTWRKGPKGWRIIAGMSCAVPRSTAATS